MKSILVFLSAIIIQSSIYQHTFITAGGDTVNMSSFEGKKILIVNIASNSPYTSQLSKLEQLYQIHKDSLVVIAFPSNSFGNEPLNNNQITTLMVQNYGIQFPISQKVNVSGTGISPVYNWLTDKVENGMLNKAVDSDFYKFLINEEGLLIGLFAPSVDPLSDELQSALK